MASSWRGAVLEQVELICTRLRQLASSSLRSLQDEFGLDVGFKPELYPAWIFGCAAVIALLAVALLLWLAACGGERRRKQQHRASSSQSSPQLSLPDTDTDKNPPPRPAKSEEPKKRNRKKASEKKTQPNGGAVPEPQQQQIKVIQELPKQQPKPEPLQPTVDAKAEKMAKKNKKKPKPEVKQPLSVSVTDVKEPDEGAWETKISNREKRQQRRKEKGDESGSPVAGERGSQQSEQVPVPAPVITKKNKANKVSNTKTAKPDAIIAPASSSWNGVNSVNAGARTETSVKISPKVKTLDSEKHVSMNMSGHRNVESMAWAQESEGTWPGMDQRNKRDLNRVNYAVLGLSSSAGDSMVKAVDLGKLDGMSSTDEWSGYNGLGTEDSGSDWNAPTEVWGNFEEPKVESPVTLKVEPVSQPTRVQESDDDVDKADPSGTGKSKRKRKKKKKTEEESAPAKVAPEVSIAPAASVVKHHAVVQVEETNKQNMTAHSNQKKSDQNRDAPKQVQKKKARRET